MAENFFTEKDKDLIVSSIKLAETNTSGEIKVHIEKKCKVEVLDRATQVFEKLGMHNTELRNAVLFYLAVEDHKFAILGDKGINDAVPDNFWNEIKDHMQGMFRLGKFSEGLSQGIEMAGNALQKYFPYADDDINELPDDLSFGPN